MPQVFVFEKSYIQLKPTVQKWSNLAQNALKWLQCVAHAVTKAYQNEENVLIWSYRHRNVDNAPSVRFWKKKVIYSWNQRFKNDQIWRKMPWNGCNTSLTLWPRHNAKLEGSQRLLYIKQSLKAATGCCISSKAWRQPKAAV